MENLAFNTAYICYSLCTLLYLIYLFTKKEAYVRYAQILLIIAFSLHFSSLVSRTFTARATYYHQADVFRSQGLLDPASIAERAARSYVPWTNWFESFSFFGAVIALLYILITWKLPIPILGAFIMPISWSLMTVAVLSDRTLRAPKPSLDSYWMTIHVPVVFTSYAILGIAFAVGVAYLIQEWQLKSRHPKALAYRLPSLEELDSLIYRLIVVALPLLMGGIVIGGFWAYTAWGQFWNWDPKETWR